VPVPTEIASMEQLKVEAEQGAEFFLLNHRIGLHEGGQPGS